MPLEGGLASNFSCCLSYSFLRSILSLFSLPPHKRAQAAAIGAGEFLDPASEDEMAAVVWRLRMDFGRAQVAAKSLKWLGYFFWHDFGTPRFGSVYFGDGLQNKDIAFQV